MSLLKWLGSISDKEWNRNVVWIPCHNLSKFQITIYDVDKRVFIFIFIFNHNLYCLIWMMGSFKCLIWLTDIEFLLFGLFYFGGINLWIWMVHGSGIIYFIQPLKPI